MTYQRGAMIGLGSPGATEATTDDDVAMERRVLSLHARRSQDLFGFAVRMGLSDEDASDAVQEAMLRLWRDLSGGKELLDLDAWAFRVVYRLAIDRHRLRERVAASLGRLFARADAVATDPADTDESAAVWAAVDTLPERQRAAIYLRYRADMTFDQIGLAMGITPGAARSHATNALATLRRRLGQEEFR
ncbi:MAG TPA: sigma-70 family RNA polymerase sigma factor [Candidatus Limnocylindrales bacterium]